MMDECIQGEQEAVQKRTFTRWINVHLERCDPPMEIQDLFTDIQDGKVLMGLLEELSGCKLLNRFRPSSHRIFKLNNIAKALAFLDDRHVKLLSIDAPSVADGNPSVVLRLIWNIILYFQVKEVTVNIQKHLSCSLSSLPINPYPSACARSPLPSVAHSNTCRKDSMPPTYHGKAIKTLLYWVQRCTSKFGVEVHDFGKSWMSGLAFLAMIKSIDPSLVDMRGTESREPKENVDKAFGIAQQSLGIPRLMEPEDVTHSTPDEQCIITYLSQFLEHHPGLDEDNAFDFESKCVNLLRDNPADQPESTSSGQASPAHPMSQALSPCQERTSDLPPLRRRMSSPVGELQAPPSPPPEQTSSAPSNIHYISLSNDHKSSTIGEMGASATRDINKDTSIFISATEPSSPFGLNVDSADQEVWTWRSGHGAADDHVNCELCGSEGYFSQSSEEGLYTLPLLDSDEEDAYSYILDLNKEESGQSVSSDSNQHFLDLNKEEESNEAVWSNSNQHCGLVSALGLTARNMAPDPLFIVDQNGTEESARECDPGQQLVESRVDIQMIGAVETEEMEGDQCKCQENTGLCYKDHGKESSEEVQDIMCPFHPVQERLEVMEEEDMEGEEEEEEEGRGMEGFREKVENRERLSVVVEQVHAEKGDVEGKEKEEDEVFREEGDGVSEMFERLNVVLEEVCAKDHFVEGDEKVDDETFRREDMKEVKEIGEDRERLGGVGRTAMEREVSTEENFEEGEKDKDVFFRHEDVNGVRERLVVEEGVDGKIGTEELGDEKQVEAEVEQEQEEKEDRHMSVEAIEQELEEVKKGNDVESAEGFKEGEMEEVEEEEDEAETKESGHVSASDDEEGEMEEEVEEEEEEMEEKEEEESGHVSVSDHEEGEMEVEVEEEEEEMEEKEEEEESGHVSVSDHEEGEMEEEVEEEMKDRHMSVEAIEQELDEVKKGNDVESAEGFKEGEVEEEEDEAETKESGPVSASDHEEGEMEEEVEEEEEEEDRHMSVEAIQQEELQEVKKENDVESAEDFKEGEMEEVEEEEEEMEEEEEEESGHVSASDHEEGEMEEEEMEEKEEELESGHVSASDHEEGEMEEEVEEEMKDRHMSVEAIEQEKLEEVKKENDVESAEDFKEGKMEMEEVDETKERGHVSASGHDDGEMEDEEKKESGHVSASGHEEGGMEEEVETKERGHVSASDHEEGGMEGIEENGVVSENHFKEEEQERDEEEEKNMEKSSGRDHLRATLQEENTAENVEMYPLSCSSDGGGISVVSSCDWVTSELEMLVVLWVLVYCVFILRN